MLTRSGDLWYLRSMTNAIQTDYQFPQTGENNMTPTYYVEVKSARVRPYMRACVVRVLDRTSGPTNWHHVRKGVVAQWGSIYKYRGHALDRSYSGSRSAYGQALASANALAAKLNSRLACFPQVQP